MSLHRTVHEGPGPTIVLLHGFTQTEASWRPVVDRLVPRHRVVTLDLPGHGGSGSVRADLTDAAALVAEALGPDPAVLVGYSMGGRIGLRLALDHPGSVRHLVLLGATAGIEEAEVREERRRADGRLADRLDKDDDLNRFLTHWLAQPMFAGLEPEPDDLAARQANRPTELAAALRSLGTGTMDPPWWPELGDLSVPVQIAWGERDAKFAGLGERLAGAIGTNAATSVLANAGHAAHLEHPAAMADLLESLVRR